MIKHVLPGKLSATTEKNSQQFLRERIEVRMYKRCVDDINVVVKVPRAGLMLMEDGVVCEGRVAGQENNMEVDKNCMQMLQSIGNNIHSSIKLEAGCPSRDEDGKLHILDFKVWIDDRRIVDGEGGERDVKLVSTCVLQQGGGF